MDKYRCQIITNVELVIRRLNQQTKGVKKCQVKNFTMIA